MATKKRRGSPRPIAHGLAVIIGAMETVNRSTLDAIASLENKMERRFTELRSELITRIEALEIAVRQLSAEVRKNSEDILLLKAQVAELTSAVHGKVDARDFAALERRVAALEDRVGVARG